MIFRIKSNIKLKSMELKLFLLIRNILLKDAVYAVILMTQTGTVKMTRLISLVLAVVIMKMQTLMQVKILQFLTLILLSMNILKLKSRLLLQNK